MGVVRLVVGYCRIACCCICLRRQKRDEAKSLMRVLVAPGFDCDGIEAKWLGFGNAGLFGYG